LPDFTFIYKLLDKLRGVAVILDAERQKLHHLVRIPVSKLTVNLHCGRFLSLGKRKLALVVRYFFPILGHLTNFVVP
jgi:hypothetical protein